MIDASLPYQGYNRMPLDTKQKAKCRGGRERKREGGRERERSTEVACITDQGNKKKKRKRKRKKSDDLGKRSRPRLA